MSEACPTCLHYARLLIAEPDLDQAGRRVAIRELAAHLTDHLTDQAEGPAA